MTIWGKGGGRGEEVEEGRERGGTGGEGEEVMTEEAPKKYTTVTIVFMKQETEPENDHSQL